MRNIFLKWLSATSLLCLPLTVPPSHAQDANELHAFVASLEGGWFGEDNHTPMGPMPFAVLFEWEEDGSLHSHSGLNRETYVDLRFVKDATGRWILREEGGLQGMGVQSYELVPAGNSEGLYRFVYEENPEYLAMEVGVRGDVMSINVLLRGEDHVRFRLSRLPEEALPRLKQQMTAAAQQSPAEGISIREAMAGSAANRTQTPSPDRGESGPIRAARAGVSQRPDDARAHLELAQALGAAIDENPAKGPRYAYEMLGALQNAIELDSHLAEAYHWLVGYYLNAPPIAGGSLDKAEETARKLAEFDLTGASPLLEQIAARRESSK